jgi:hypothetical protein
LAKSLPERIELTAAQLAQLQARQRLQVQAEKARARKLAKREQARMVSALLRSADARRKIALGGIVIAARADGVEPAELCGSKVVSVCHSTVSIPGTIWQLRSPPFAIRRPATAPDFVGK